jgi:hypothetical protein
MKSSEIETRVTGCSVTKTELLNASSERSANLAFFLLVVLVGLFLLLTPAKAQGFLPGDIDAARGTIDDVLKGAGTVDNIVGSLGGLIEDFTFDKFLASLCPIATAVNGEIQDTGSQDAQDTICTITSMFDQVNELFDVSETTMENAQGLFADSSLFGMNVGNLISGNPEQLEGILGEIEAFLEEKDPSKMTEMARATFENMAVTEARNYETAPEGSIQGDFNNAMESNPQLGMAHVQGLYQQADLNTQQVEAMAALEGSRGIAEAMSTSTSPDKLVESITPGEDDKGIAPALRNEANAAVSTRATVQEVVEAITYYMEQDVRQFAYLSEQLTLQAQQQVYTGKMLQLSANAILAEQKQENDQARAKLEAAVHEVTVQVETGADNVMVMARAFNSVGDPEVTQLADGIAALTNF